MYLKSDLEKIKKTINKKYDLLKINNIELPILYNEKMER